MTQSFPTPAQQTLKQLKTFLGCYLVFWIASSLSLLLWGYQGSFLFFNSLHSPIGDAIMPHYTHLADGIFVSCILAIFALPKQKDLIISLILSLILVAIATQYLKRGVFPSWDRPPLVFENIASVHYISTEGEKHHSFPSGHSAGAGLLFAFVAYYWQERYKFGGLVAALLGISIAYSRVYIGVHFVGDILVGSLIGVGIALFGLILLRPRIETLLHTLSPQTQNYIHWGLYTLLGIALVLNIGRYLYLYQIL